MRPDVWAATPFPLSAQLGRTLLLGTRKAGDAIDERIRRVTASLAQAAPGEGGTTRHAGYAISQRIRKRIEEPFGWSKTVGLAAKAMLRGLERAGGQFIFNLAAHNLVRLPKLLAA